MDFKFSDLLLSTKTVILDVGYPLTVQIKQHSVMDMSYLSLVLSEAESRDSKEDYMVEYILRGLVSWDLKEAGKDEIIPISKDILSYIHQNHLVVSNMLFLKIFEFNNIPVDKKKA